MPESPPLTPQGFDEWAKLARTDPQAFETQRQRVINRAIRAAPAERQPQLRRIQWKLDQIRNTSRTPMLACLRINRLLWESLAGEGGLLACLQHPATFRQQRAARASARIIPLHRGGCPDLPQADG